MLLCPLSCLVWPDCSGECFDNAVTVGQHEVMPSTWHRSLKNEAVRILSNTSKTRSLQRNPFTLFVLIYSVSYINNFTFLFSHLNKVVEILP